MSVATIPTTIEMAPVSNTQARSEAVSASDDGRRMFGLRRISIIRATVLSVFVFVAVPVGSIAAYEMNSAIKNAVEAGHFPDNPEANLALAVFTGLISGAGALGLIGVPAANIAGYLYDRFVTPVETVSPRINGEETEAEDTV